LIESPSLLLTLGAFLLLLGPLIVLHELGHYYAGRLFGVRALTFSVGIGKELWHRIDKRGTRWRIAAIPLGGYVLFAGDADASSKPDPALEHATPEELKGTFPGAALWQRTLIVLAGPIANLLVAVAIYFGFAMAYGVPYVPPVVSGFSDHSAAQQAGIQLGDRITAIDGAEVADFTEIAPRIMLYAGQTLTITVDRAGRKLEFPVKVASVTEKDRFGNEGTRGMIGVAGAGGEFRSAGPIDAADFAVSNTWQKLRMTAVGLKQVVMGERSIREMGGLPKTAKASGEMLSLGWLAFIEFAAFVSINLAFINLLPIPTLDGGHLAFYAAEAVRRRPLGVRSQEFAFRFGLALVIAVAVFVNINDLVSLFGK
jgi:regulator of sigma E protease